MNVHTTSPPAPIVTSTEPASRSGGTVGAEDVLQDPQVVGGPCHAMSVPCLQIVERLTLPIGQAEVGLVGSGETKDCIRRVGLFDDGQRSALDIDRSTDCRITRGQGQCPTRQQSVDRAGQLLIPAPAQVPGDGVRGAGYGRTHARGLRGGVRRIEVNRSSDRVPLPWTSNPKGVPSAGSASLTTRAWPDQGDSSALLNAQVTS